ncbi:MAG: hypothetical protein SGJ18_15110 [Pseudomonadota bacterium]|nr:hypothetical protein [Pseudomonadota bacterium]
MEQSKLLTRTELKYIDELFKVRNAVRAAMNIGWGKYSKSQAWHYLHENFLTTTEIRRRDPRLIFGGPKRIEGFLMWGARDGLLDPETFSESQND